MTETIVGWCEIVHLLKHKRFDVWHAGFTVAMSSSLVDATEYAERMVYPADVVGWYLAEIARHDIEVTRDQFVWTGEVWGYTLDGADPLDWIVDVCGCEGECLTGVGSGA